MSEDQPINHEIESTHVERRVIKLTANLPVEVYANLKVMAEKRNTTVTQVLRSAINHERFFMEQTDQGNRILIDREGEIRELIFLP